jgi:hypothetical protein
MSFYLSRVCCKRLIQGHLLWQGHQLAVPTMPRWRAGCDGFSRANGCAHPVVNRRRSRGYSSLRQLEKLLGGHLVSTRSPPNARSLDAARPARKSHRFFSLHPPASVVSFAFACRPLYLIRVLRRLLGRSSTRPKSFPGSFAPLFAPSTCHRLRPPPAIARQPSHANHRTPITVKGLTRPDVTCRHESPFARRPDARVRGATGS